MIRARRRETTEEQAAAQALYESAGHTLADTREVTANLALEYGYRYTPRLHVDLWNDAPET